MSVILGIRLYVCVGKVIVFLHHACWQQLVEDVVHFSSLELSKMWQQCLDDLQPVLSKLLNLLGTSSCNDSYVQDALE